MFTKCPLYVHSLLEMKFFRPTKYLIKHQSHCLNLPELKIPPHPNLQVNFINYLPTICPLYVHYTFTLCSVYIHYMFTKHPLYSPTQCLIKYQSHCQNLPELQLPSYWNLQVNFIKYLPTICPLYVHYAFTLCSMYIHHMFTKCTLYVYSMLTMISFRPTKYLIKHQSHCLNLPELQLPPYWNLREGLLCHL